MKKAITLFLIFMCTISQNLSSEEEPRLEVKAAERKLEHKVNTQKRVLAVNNGYTDKKKLAKENTFLAIEKLDLEYCNDVQSTKIKYSIERNFFELENARIKDRLLEKILTAEDREEYQKAFLNFKESKIELITKRHSLEMKEINELAKLRLSYINASSI